MFKVLRCPRLGIVLACLLAAGVMVLAAAKPAQASVLTVSTGTGWNAISLPYQPINGDPWDLFDELRPPAQSLDLLSGSLHRYDNPSSSYMTYSRQTPTVFGPAGPGRGYWLWVSAPVNIGYQCVAPTSVPRIVLQGADWHLVGLPRLGAFRLSDVLVTNTGTGQKKLLGDAAAAGWVQLPIIGIQRSDGDGSGTNYVSLPASGQALTDVAFEAYAAYWMNQFVPGLALAFDSPPANLGAQATSFAEVRLTWSDNSSYDTGYEVERRIPPAGFQRIATLAANTNAYTDATVSASTSYEYRVRGLNAVGFTAYSNTASVTTPDPPGAAPIGTAVDVVSDGSYAYVASSEYGVVVVDVRNPTSPRGVGVVNVGFAPTHLDRYGNLVVAIGGASGMAVINVSNPAAPVRVGSLTVPAAEVAVSNQYAYLADATAGQPGYFRVVDLGNPSSPTQIAVLEVGRLPREIATVGSYAYVASSKGMLVIDISAPSAPAVVASSAIVCGLATAKPGYAYVDGAPFSGIQVVDIRDPKKPTKVGEHQMTSMLNRFVVQDNILYTACHDISNPIAYLRIIDVSDPTNPFTTRYCLMPGTANGVAVYGRYVYVADGAAGLQVVDVNDPYKPVIVGNAR